MCLTRLFSSHQEGKLTPQLVRPSPPSFGPGFTSEYQIRESELL